MLFRSLYLLEKLIPRKKNLKGLLFKAYQILYIVMVFSGSVQSVDLVWELTDFINACMALPNLLCLLLLFRKIPADPEEASSDTRYTN